MARSEMDISRVVKTLLTHQGRSRTELAQYLDVHVSAITRSMKGERPWKLSDIVVMAKVFSVPEGWFFDDPATLVRKTCFLPDLVSA